MKLPFSGREPTRLRERLLDALDRVGKADKVFFAPLGEGFYVYVMPPTYDFAAERERFDREAEEARQAVMGETPLGSYTLINFREIRQGRLPYSDGYQQWAGKHALKLTGQIGLIFLVRAEQVQQVIAQECQRAGLECEPQDKWNMRVSSADKSHTLYTGDMIYEAIGRAVDLSELVREQLAQL